MTAKTYIGFAGQRHAFEEVGGEDGLGLGTQERRPGLAAPLRCWVDAGFFADLPRWTRQR